MKASPLFRILILAGVALVAALLTGCASSGGLAGIGMRANGNQSFVLKQQYVGGGTAADPAGSAVAANPTARQGGSGGIVNNFYLGPNSAAQEAAKSTDALKAAANTNMQGSGVQQTKSNAAQQPAAGDQNNAGDQDADPPAAPVTPVATPE